MFNELLTDRLIVRGFVASDAPLLQARRNDPEVSLYQNWERPFSRENANAIVQSLMAMDGPTDGEWWMATICDRVTGEVVGDLSVELTWDGRSAEIGYNLDRRFWGCGYAAEAAEAFVRYLFEQEHATRVFGMLHPDNTASAQVLERCGLVFEGHTRLSYWDDDGPSDDWIYGSTAEAWRKWDSRKKTAPSEVLLVPVTIHNERKVARLKTHKSQEAFVAPVLASYADALFPEIVDGSPVSPILRAIEADGEVVGFVMVADTTVAHPEPFLWRFLIDRMHQRRGIGSMALNAVVAERSAAGDSTLVTSWQEGRGTPAPFYRSHGFVETGREIDGETEARLTF